MSSYRFYGPIAQVVSASGVMTGTNVLTTPPVDVASYESFCFQPVWTGTPTGTLVILASVDGVNYADLGASIPTQPAGSASSAYIPVYASCAKYLKLQYTNASGTGVLTCTALGKTR